MDSLIVKKRFDEVTENDATAESIEDFFATHVPIEKLITLDDFEFQPSSDSDYTTEEEVYQRYIKNVNDKHQFIVVYGEAGTGKSHLIRWFKERFEKEKEKNEVILFISRNDNSLKGTIRQLLSHPEVQNVNNKELMDRLTSASTSVDPERMKNQIYKQFIIEVEQDILNSDDKEEGEVVLKGLLKKNLPAFLNNNFIQEHMFRDYGPIHRIFSKIVKQDVEEFDTDIKFTKEDFVISSELYDRLSNYADRGALKLIKKLRTDEKGEEVAEKISIYLNKFVDSVIQFCAGIHPEDFQLLFTSIREQLYNDGKNLTIFIEDITSTTGVNKALIDALMTNHRAVIGKNVCRLSSIIGTTSGYFQSDIRGNFQQRASKYIYIPTGVFNEERLYELFGKYINTMSLEQSKIAEWVSRGMLQSEYPVHETKEGKGWETYRIGDLELNLYPFTKKAIVNLYETKLNQKTPRFIIKHILRPVLSDVIYQLDSFPGEKYKYNKFVNSTLSQIVRAKLKDNMADCERLLRFMHLWGNAKNESYTENGVRYICGISEQMYSDMHLPIVDLEEVSVPVPTASKIEEHPKVETKASVTNEYKNNSSISQDAYDKVARVTKYLDDWVNGKKIVLSSNAGESGIIRRAIDDIKSFVLCAINWQVEGLSLDLRKRVSDGIQIVSLESTAANSKSFIKLPCNRDSVDLLLSFVKWREYGKKSWNYEDGAYLDVYTVQSWFIANKERLICAFTNENLYKYDCSDYALAFELLYMVITSEFKNEKLDSLPVDQLFMKRKEYSYMNQHCEKWKQVVDWMNTQNREQECSEVIRDTFNIRQGTQRSQKVVIDYLRLKEAIKRVVKLIPTTELEDHLPDSDPISKRLEVCKNYCNLKKKISDLLEDESDFLSEYSEFICDIFDIDVDDDIDEDDIADLLEEIKSFFDVCDHAKIHGQGIGISDFNNKEKILAKNINLLNNTLCEQNFLKKIINMSHVPINRLKPFKDLLSRVISKLNEVDKFVDNYKSSHPETNAGKVVYNEEVVALEKCILGLEEIEVK